MSDTVPVAGYQVVRKGGKMWIAPCPASGPCNLCKAVTAQDVMQAWADGQGKINVCTSCLPKMQQFYGQPKYPTKLEEPKQPGNGKIAGQINPASEESR